MQNKLYLFKILYFLLFLTSCKREIKQQAIAPQTPQNNAIAEATVNATPNAVMGFPTFPGVWLKTDLSNVLVRDTPSVFSFYTYVFPYSPLFMGQQTAFKDAIPIRGKSIPSPWYLISKEGGLVSMNDKSRHGWVYGACVYPYLFDFTAINDSSQSEITKRWVVLEKIDSSAFTKLAVRRDTVFQAADSVARPGKIRMKFAHRDTLLINRYEEGEGFCVYYKLKELNDWYILLGSYTEWADCIFVKKSDGRFFYSMGMTDQLIRSPDKRFCLFSSHQGYQDCYNGGLEIFDLKTGRFTSFHLNNAYVKNIAWSASNEILFAVPEYGKPSAYYKLNIKGLIQ